MAMNEMEQLDSDAVTHDEPKAPSSFWATVLGRAAFGFYVEASNSEYFVNDEYLRKLCDVENNLSNRYGKVVFWTAAIALFSIATVSGALGDTEYLGMRIANIPYLTEFCVFLLGAAVVGQIVILLDSIVISRMRNELFSITGSQVPNMRMVHLKGNNAWIDALIPKRVGYSSNILHAWILWVGYIWAISIPLVFLGIAIGAQAVCYSSLEGKSLTTIGGIVATTGIAVNALSLLMLILVTCVPIKFTLK